MGGRKRKLLVWTAAVVLFLLAFGVFGIWAMGTSWFWEFQISAYEKKDRIQPPPKGEIVFTGSSSIFFWDTLSEDMKPLHAFNRGFGGSQLSQVDHYASRIVIPYQPRAVVLYAGENDMSWPWSKSSDTVLQDLQQFVKEIHTALPDAWIYYISMKPSPDRWGDWPAFDATNRKIESWCGTQDRVRFIDVSRAMLDEHGTVRHELFRRDGLHMNAEGYALWTSIIKPVLLERIGPEVH
jgi:lysophospholipase L1-like esterase